ncbi:MAG: FtsW/RodA/SpoVE family cell cycle protein [Planctomycetota bacterium]|jgi:rod shape-determining protein RodA|nr:FtsW/RodA/SpoVE family cell cycle protein [Planctomycetota bacterium]
MRKIDPWRVDWEFLAAALAVIALGLPFLRSSASSADFVRQIVWLAFGLAAMIVFALVDHHRWMRFAYWGYAASLLLLIVVLRAPPINNAHSYLRFGPIGMQPSELLKLTLILALARHLGKRENQRMPQGLILPFLITLAPLYLILRQPDLGTALTIPPILLVMLWMSGARFSHLFSGILLGLASIWPLWEYVMRPYQKARIYAFLDPERYETAEAYQLLMSLAAIGSSGVFGQGLGNGIINELDLLPEKHNDFIFGVIAEEGGWVAAAGMILLFLVLTLIGFHISVNAQDRFGRLLAAGAATIIGWQAVLNIYVVTGLLPTTGVTLPLVSYGGSSMVVTCALIGLVLNVSQSSPKLEKMENPDKI